VRLAVADHLHTSLGGDIYAAPAILREMVAAGQLGKKSGRGFYAWPTPH
jgi:3-hydroxybutyryl-CoA dehydrogenase